MESGGVGVNAGKVSFGESKTDFQLCMSDKILSVVRPNNQADQIAKTGSYQELRVQLYYISPIIVN